MVSVRGIFHAFMWVIPFLILLIVASIGIDSLVNYKLNDSIISKYNSLPTNCGGHSSYRRGVGSPEYVCDRDIDTLNISPQEKEILKFKKYQYPIVFGFLCLFLLLLLSFIGIIPKPSALVHGFSGGWSIALENVMNDKKSKMWIYGLIVLGIIYIFIKFYPGVL